MALIAARLNAEVILVVTGTDRYIICLPPPPHLHTPFPLFSPSLISLTVSVDVKHHVYTYLFETELILLPGADALRVYVPPGFALAVRKATQPLKQPACSYCTRIIFMHNYVCISPRPSAAHLCLTRVGRQPEPDCERPTVSCAR